MIRRIAPLAALALLSGCGWVGLSGFETDYDRVGDVPLFLNLEILSVINTKKTMGDHVATWVTGKDCSTIRAQREGVWCVDWSSPPPPPQQVYCYASLAKPSCFSQPYNEGNDRLIGFVPAPVPVR